MPAGDKAIFPSSAQVLYSYRKLGHKCCPYGISCESTMMFMKCSYLITHVFLLQAQALTVTLGSVLSF